MTPKYSTSRVPGSLSRDIALEMPSKVILLALVLASTFAFSAALKCYETSKCLNGDA